MSRIIENPKQLILETAKQIMYKDGYDKLNIRNVAKSCNISIGTIYNYYPTKKELVIDLMSGYWDSMFEIIEVLFSTEKDLYSKLRSFQQELQGFIRKFKEVWLMDKFYSTPNFVESGIQRENVYMKLLIGIVEEMLAKDNTIIESRICNRLELEKLSEFILLNLITIIQMPVLNYETFESVLRQLLQR